MTANANFLLSTSDTIAIYVGLLSSINTIWNIYIFVLLGIVGWILARAHEFEKPQKIIITIVFTVFNAVVLFYFYDAYEDINRIRIELTAHQDKFDLQAVKDGISENLVTFLPINRFIKVAAFVMGFWLFVLFLVWSKKIWTLRKAA